MTEDVEKDRQRAEVFDALGHPSRTIILKALSEEPLGFADLKKRLGIESNGQLQHHLSKLGNLIKIDESSGRYCLSENRRDALFAVQTVERVTEPHLKGTEKAFFTAINAYTPRSRLLKYISKRRAKARTD